MKPLFRRIEAENVYGIHCYAQAVTPAAQRGHHVFYVGVK